ncbi:class I SAM-dependent methyltransferase [Thalassospira tepidiphila]|uniref:SAM-dependent methyltransferase n=2 Tax=Thalassospira tepidiphila TaxID=393657 RepID=A0A853L0G2_9PROT|nr:class I SAM-dependent methyltransferase [Thalassospira tepidiphila]NJB74761.1 cyclopropane fatty-acyl-phospholipid synthase-like methyltransferase [Thalassospira tepidiphila]OAZ10168.1 SAM-dependent methyltransferase [Thalassospira tepidiphila MCCC 1A03514]
MTTPTCRACGTDLKHTLVDLGLSALANSYVPMDRADQNDPRYPLHARVCGNCFLVQVDDVVPPSDIFSHYAYFSSYSSSWVEHARKYCEAAAERLDLGKDSFVVEVASNDGYLLQHFVAKSIPVLGVEPAANIAKEAEKKGVKSLVAFFGKETAEKVVAEHGHANLTAANNVLAHVPDINDFVSGFATVLADDGVSTFEFPHLLNLLEKTQFDTIYHEHFSYLSLYAVEKCFEQNGLKVFDVEELPTHGGSLRVWAQKTIGTRPETDRLAALRAKEADAGIATLACYEGFDAKCRKIRDDLLAFLKSAKTEGKTVAGYGAAAKGNTLLNYCDIGTNLIDFVVDANPHKQNTLLPGSHIPVHAPDHLKVAKPNYVLILPWNLSTEIMKDMAHVKDWGGQFMVAIPKVEVIG